MIKKILVSIALATTVASSAFASVVQTTPVSGHLYSPGGAHHVIGRVDFAAGTNEIFGLTSIVSLVDQGWGGEDPGGNHVVLGLFKNDTYLWGTHAAGAYHHWTTQAFDILNAPAALTSLNDTLGAIDWAADTTVSMRMFTSGHGWSGWSLTTQNASFTVTSGVVPEPGSVALLGLGLAGLAMARRRKLSK